MATTDKAYCSEEDVKAITGVSGYTTTTMPTEAEMLLFTENRSAELYVALTAVMGSNAVGPSGYATPIDTGTDAGLALSHYLRSASAIGAAADCLEAAGAGESPGRTERIIELRNEFEAMKATDALKPLATAYLGFATRSATLALPTATSPVDRVYGLNFHDETKF